MRSLMVVFVAGILLPASITTADDGILDAFQSVEQNLIEGTEEFASEAGKSLEEIPNLSEPISLIRISSSSSESCTSGNCGSDSGNCSDTGECATACTESVTGCGSACDPCCPEFWEHRTGFFGELLFLSPGNVDYAYAVPVDGTSSTAVPVGSVAIVDPGYEAGFRVGGAWAIDSCSSFAASFTSYENHATHSQSIPGGLLTGPYLKALTVHPQTVDVAADSLDAECDYDIDFQFADAVFQGLLRGDNCSSLNYELGLRYGHLDQDFAARYSINGRTDVDTDLDFDGIGPRIGLRGERLIGNGLLVYAKGAANFLIGDFNADYVQQNAFDGIQATSSLEDDRIVSILEMELGVGWQNCCGSFRVTGGYLVQAWFNTMTVPAYIDSVQSSSFNEVSETLTFDGFSVRAEYRF